jgi:hypothetical protein
VTIFSSKINNNNNLEISQQQAIAQPKLQWATTYNNTFSYFNKKITISTTDNVNISPISSTSSSSNQSSLNKYSPLNQTSPSIKNLINNSFSLNSYFQTLNKPNGIQKIKKYSANYLQSLGHLTSTMEIN